jgi:chemotaxis protein MotB
MSDRPIIVIKKKGGHGGHHGGAWKVAYADFVTAMMALFLVLWLVAQSPQVASNVGEYFRNPEYYDSLKDGVMSGSTGLNEMRTKNGLLDMSVGSGQARQRLEIAARKMRDGMRGFGALRDQVTVSITPEGLLIQLVESDDQALFAVGSAVPTPETREVLLELGAEIGRMPNRVVISGHTDRRGYASKRPYTNWELSSDRANTARRVLIEGGMSQAQVGRVAGYADTQPLDPADPMAAMNRRITILVTPEEIDQSETFFDVFPEGDRGKPSGRGARPSRSSSRAGAVADDEEVQVEVVEDPPAAAPAPPPQPTLKRYGEFDEFPPDSPDAPESAAPPPSGPPRAPIIPDEP